MNLEALHTQTHKCDTAAQSRDLAHGIVSSKPIHFNSHGSMLHFVFVYKHLDLLYIRFVFSNEI